MPPKNPNPEAQKKLDAILKLLDETDRTLRASDAHALMSLYEELVDAIDLRFEKFMGDWDPSVPSKSGGLASTLPAPSGSDDSSQGGIG